jgi:hypothetical protein
MITTQIATEIHKQFRNIETERGRIKKIAEEHCHGHAIGEIAVLLDKIQERCAWIEAQIGTGAS